MKTVILDGKTTNPGDLSWDFLKKYGEVEIFDRTPREKIVERTHDADIVVTNKTPLTRAEIDKMQNVKFVALLSTGYNVVDCAYLKERAYRFQIYRLIPPWAWRSSYLHLFRSLP